MITQFWNLIGEVVTGGVGVFANLFQAVLGLFIDSTTANAITFTTFGQLLIIVVGTPLVMWGVNWVVGLFRSIRLSRGKR